MDNKKSKSVTLVGYINLFKNRTGFSFPVFKIGNKLFVQDGIKLDNPAPALMEKKNLFFYEFENPVKIYHDIQKERLGIFVYAQGEKYALLSSSDPFAIYRIPEDSLSKQEFKELSFRRSKKSVYLVLEQFNEVIDEYSLDHQKIDELYYLSKDLLTASGLFNVEVIEIWIKKVNFFEVLLENCKEHYKILSVWLSILRFQNLSSKGQIYIHSKIFPTILEAKNLALLELFYYLGIKYRNTSILRELYRIDFENSLEMMLGVLGTIHSLETIDNYQVETHIEVLVSSMENWLKTIPLSEMKPQIKTKLIELQSSLMEKEALIAFQEQIGIRLIPLVSDEFSDLLNYKIQSNS